MKTLMKQYLAMVYEALLMLALTMTLTALYYALVGDASHGLKRLGLQGLLWLSMGAYFVRCWTVSGQSLASQTWKLKVVGKQGELLTSAEAVRRYLLASVLLLAGGISLWWALIDREHCFLHDRLLGSRIILISA